MLIILSSDSKRVVTNTLYPDGNIPFIELQENEEVVRIHDNSLVAQKILTAYQYDLIFDTEGNCIDANVIKTLAEFKSEQITSVSEPIDEEKAAMAEAIIDLDMRLSALEK